MTATGVGPRTRPVNAEIAIKVSAMLDIAIFPVGPNKVPKIKGGHGLNDASFESDEIKRLWKLSGSAYVGVNAGRSALTIVDIDSPDEVTPEMGLAILNTPTLTFRSLNRGTPHHWFRGTRPSHPIAGGDIKSTGGFILLSPDKDMVDIPIADWTPELESAAVRIGSGSRKVGSLTASGWEFRITDYGIDQLQALANQVGLAEEGIRNNELHHAAVVCGHLIVEGNLTPEAVIDILTRAASQTGLSDREIQATIRNGLLGPMTTRRDALTEEIERLADE